MKVFGIGLNKTGTSTLRDCCRQFGLRHVSCRRDLLIAYRRGALDEVFAVIDQHDSFDDWPWPLMYRELYDRYAGQGAKFVLTLRASPDKWLRSLKKHALYTIPGEHCRGLAYGHNYPFRHEAHHLDFYRRHADEVRTFFQAQGAADRLLEVCWENGDGWPELCRFLDLPVPEVPFPHANVTGSRRQPILRALRNRYAAGYWGRI